MRVTLTGRENKNDLQALKLAARKIADDRSWHEFHRPRSLVLALVAEAGELAAEVQWLADELVDQELSQSDARQRIEHELGDILYCLLRLSDVLEIDLERAYLDKLRVISAKYPISSGSVAPANAVCEQELS